jgi:PRC-barrel domain
MRIAGVTRAAVAHSKRGELSVTAAFDPWSYRAETGVSTGGMDLIGYEVEAIDGRIGKIDEATYDVGGSYLVVDTGPWIFGKKVLLPAGTVDRIDVDDRKVYVDRTKD